MTSPPRLDQPSAPAARTDERLPGYIRAAGRIAAEFRTTPLGTRAMRLSEGGGYRLMFPRGRRCEAMLLNTAGGVAGGDRLDVDLAFGDGTEAVVSSQSAEKIYRADGDAARTRIALAVGAGARLSWLPLETILFNGARLVRRFDIDLAGTARLLMCEMAVLGRIAMGERPTDVHLDDQWRVRRAGRLVHAEATRIDGDATRLLAGRATGADARAIATLACFSEDAAARLEPLRERLGGMNLDLDWGASAWNGLIKARFSAADPAEARRAVAAALAVFDDVEIPRVWGL
ncbi:urease accessory protein UreD [Pleomorphomonas koreensis]|uniref:urease accessory protein UreD n=1 Tax=Pleomorphomonas koreensis TaxID=257440 RepID=UPI000429BE05|nr:urease accessory protein UreD [Pleomorphomonas koreensis]